MKDLNLLIFKLGGIGKDYLRALLTDLVTEIATNENLDLEIQAKFYVHLFFEISNILNRRKVNYQKMCIDQKIQKFNNKLK